ncbi:MAG: hypothetical protein H7Z10_04390, partial [Gemmatimonadaceae bacterium]|nr:hypothetical protein [Acetobacteraceae bacterium]
RSLNQIIGDVRDILDMPALSVVRTPARAADVPISVLDTTLIQRHTGWRATMDWTVGLASTAGWMRGAYGL